VYRKTLLLLLTISPLLFCAGASADDGWARRMFDSLEYDFGDLARGADAEHRFKISNIYQEDIRIASVRSSCGCTAPKLTEQLIKSGQSGELIVKFNTIAFKGAHSATITVTFEPPFDAEVRILVHGFVRSDVVFQPGRIEFGSVASTAGAEKVVRVSYAGRADWRITDVRSSNRDVEVNLTEEERKEGRVVYEMQFRLKQGAPPGYINDRLTIVTNDPDHRYIPLPIEGRVTDDSITVSPTELHLGKLQPGETVTKQLVVRGSAPFRIVDIGCASGSECFDFIVGDSPRKLHLIPVKFTAPAKPGPVSEEIKITGDETAVAIPTIVADAEIEASEE
jgi:hypothetical protein